MTASGTRLWSARGWGPAPRPKIASRAGPSPATSSTDIHGAGTDPTPWKPVLVSACEAPVGDAF
eukprot:6423211-Lingulodinium_polyedra.AAC.1